MPVVTLDVVVDDLDEMLELYNRIEVYRSTTTDDGTYTELTDVDGPLSAILDGTNSTWGNIAEKELSFYLDGSEDPVVVALPDIYPMSLQVIIDAINDAVDEAVASEVPTSTNLLRLTSPTTGTGSSVQVVAGDAATALGLDTDLVTGKERRIRLITPTTLYAFSDKTGDNAYWYKTRFSNTENADVSDYSTPRQGDVDIVVPADQLVKGFLTLIDGLGRPVVGRRLIFIPMESKMVVNTTAWVIPGFDARIEVATNESGYASANLLQGLKYRVIVEGTTFIREFTTPADVTPFDVMTIVGDVPDPFDIAQPPPRPIKMTT